MKRDFLTTPKVVTVEAADLARPGRTLETLLGHKLHGDLKRLSLIPANLGIRYGRGAGSDAAELPRTGRHFEVNQLDGHLLQFWSAEHPTQMVVCEFGEPPAEPAKARQSCYADHVSDPHHSPALPATPATAPARLGE